MGLSENSASLSAACYGKGHEDGAIVGGLVSDPFRRSPHGVGWLELAGYGISSGPPTGGMRLRPRVVSRRMQARDDHGGSHREGCLNERADPAVHVFVVHTESGNYAKVRITALNPEIIIDYTTYQVTGLFPTCP
jgi:hypothetical protein